MLIWAAIALGVATSSLAVWSGFAGLRRRRSAQHDDRWRALAARLELSPAKVPGVPHRFVGRYRGREIEVLVARRGWAELRTTVKAPLPAGLHLVHQATAQVLGLRHLRDVVVGATDFDRDVIVHAAHPAGVIRLLRDGPTREAVYALLRSQPYTYFVGSDAIVHLRPEVDEPTARAAVRKLCDAAELVEEQAREIALEGAHLRAQARGAAPPAEARAESLAGPAAPLAPSEAGAEQRAIIDRAALRRTLLVLTGAAPIAVGLVLLVLDLLIRLADPESPLPGALRAYTFVSWGIGIMMLSISLPRYSCPACKARVTDSDGGPDFSAHSCPSCGVRLR